VKQAILSASVRAGIMWLMVALGSTLPCAASTPFFGFSLRESPIGLDIRFKMLNQVSELIAQHEGMPADQNERPVAVPVSL
jgi:hypothetical protein